MTPENFDDLAQDPYAQDQYAQEAAQRWPDNFAQSQQRISELRPSQQKEILDTHGDIARALAGLFKSAVAADAPEVQEQIDRHYRWVCNFWTPDAKAYEALGQMYLDDERFTATYDAFAVGLTPFIRDAILRYAASNLA